jgi:hypothetical protein
MPVVQAQLVLPPGDDDRAPSRLAPLDPKNPWHARFAGAARTLQPALASGIEADWLPHFGGQWLGAAELARIGAMLADESGALRRTLAGPTPSEFVVLGWQPPEGGAAYAAIADRPEGDAILCWRPANSARAWPTTAAEAEDRQAHGCVRMSYSVRFDPPQWRAFLDAPMGLAD